MMLKIKFKIREIKNTILIAIQKIKIMKTLLIKYIIKTITLIVNIVRQINLKEKIGYKK